MLPCDWREWRAAARVSPRAPAGCLGPAHEGSGLHEVSLLVERPQSGVQQYAEPARGEAIGTSAGGGRVLAETQVELARESRRHATGGGRGI